MMDHLSECNCDQCLLTKMRAADAVERAQGWELWYRRDAPILYGYLKQLCWERNCLEMADDLLQDTFLVAFKNVSSGCYDEQKAVLRAYLHGIARNLVREAVRARQRVTLSLDTIESESDASLGLDDLYYLAELRRHVKEAVTLLPSLSQRVIVDLYVKDKAPTEVAKSLRITPGNTRIMAHRAIKQIGNFLERQHHVRVPAHAIRMCLE